LGDNCWDRDSFCDNLKLCELGKKDDECKELVKSMRGENSALYTPEEDKVMFYFVFTGDKFPEWVDDRFSKLIIN